MKKSAKDRKRIRAEKMRARKMRAEKPPILMALIDEFDRWMRREPPEAFTTRCKACGKDVLVTYASGRMQYGHAEPVCKAHRSLEKLAGTESATLEAWKDPAADSPLPVWAEGPRVELSREQGEALVDAGRVWTSSLVTQGLPDGGSETSMFARTGEGLVWWLLETIPPYRPPEASAKDRQREKPRAEKILMDLNYEYDRWMRREPPEPFTASCKGCGKDVFVTYEAGRMQHGHVDPVCTVYRVFELSVGTESMTLESWKDPNVPSPLPQWAKEPWKRLTREEGEELVFAGQVDTSSAVNFEVNGSAGTAILARIAEDVFWWTLEARPG